MKWHTKRNVCICKDRSTTLNNYLFYDHVLGRCSYFSNSIKQFIKKDRSSACAGTEMVDLVLREALVLSHMHEWREPQMYIVSFTERAI